MDAGLINIAAPYLLSFARVQAFKRVMCWEYRRESSSE